MVRGITEEDLVKNDKLKLLLVQEIAGNCECTSKWYLALLNFLLTHGHCPSQDAGLNAYLVQSDTAGLSVLF